VQGGKHHERVNPHSVCQNHGYSWELFIKTVGCMKSKHHKAHQLEKFICFQRDDTIELGQTNRICHSYRKISPPAVQTTASACQQSSQSEHGKGRLHKGRKPLHMISYMLQQGQRKSRSIPDAQPQPLHVLSSLQKLDLSLPWERCSEVMERPSHSRRVAHVPLVPPFHLWRSHLPSNVHYVTSMQTMHAPNAPVTYCAVCFGRHAREPCEHLSCHPCGSRYATYLNP